MFLQADRLWLLYTAFAVAGLGVGMVYNGVISAVVPRFPDRKGFASGVLLMASARARCCSARSPRA